MTPLQDGEYRLWQLTQQCITKIRYEPLPTGVSAEALCKAALRDQLQALASGARSP